MKKLLLCLLPFLFASAYAADPAPPSASGSITTQNLVSAGDATANSCVLLTTQGWGVAGVEVSGTYTGALSAQGTVRGTTWQTLAPTPFIPSTAQTTPTATIGSGSTGSWTLGVAGYKTIRICGLAAVTGQADLNLIAAPGGGVSSGSSGGGGGGAVTEADGANNALGATTDSASGTDVAGTVNAHLRELTKASVQLPAAMGQTTAALSLPVVQASDATPTVSQGSTTPGQKGNLTQGAVTTSAPTYTTAQTSPLSLSTTGDLRTADATAAAKFTTTASTDSLRLPVSPPDSSSGTATCSATCNTTNSGVMFSSLWAGYNSIDVYVTSIGGGVTFTFEYSEDSTNGVDGTWGVLVGTNPSTTAAAPLVPYSATSSLGGTKFARAGKWFRVRSSAYTSGTVTFYYTMSSANVPGVLTVSVGNGVPISNGQATQGGTPATSPLQLGVEARTTGPTAVSSGQSARVISTTLGVPIVRPWTIPELEWSYAAATGGISNTTTAVTMVAAGGSGVRNYLTSCQVSSDALGAASELAIRDGAGGTVLWRLKVGTAGILSYHIGFGTPLKSTANTLLEVVTLTASVTGGVFVNCQGFQAP